MSYSTAGTSNITISNAWQLLEAENPDPSQSSNMAIYQNGSLISTTGGITSTSNFTSNLYINGRGGTSTNSFPGQFGELIVYSNALTASQRQQVEGYLAKKWGLLSSLPANHPFVSLPPSTALPFLPTNITGCCLWLDGYDPLGTGVQPTQGATITSWIDKSGSNNTMTAVNSPTWSYAKPGSVPGSRNFVGGYVTLDGTSQYLYRSTPVVSNVYTLLILYYQTSTATGPLYTTTTVTDKSGLFANEAGQTYLTLGDSTWYYAASSVFPSNAATLATTMYSSVTSNASLYYNGSNVVSTSLSNSITYTNLTIGSRQNNGTEYLGGSIAEVIAYSGTLTDNQRHHVEGYLQHKYKF